MSDFDIIVCWSCGKEFNEKQHQENDGYCIHCDAGVIIDDD